MKQGNWVPMDKNLIKTLGNLDRPYSVVEAMFCHQYNVDCGKEWTLRGYAKLWQWSVGKVKRLVEGLRNTSGTVVERKGNGSGTAVRFVYKTSGGLKEHKQSSSGTVAEHKQYANIKPKPKPKEKALNNNVEKPPVFNGDAGEVFKYWQEALNHPRAKLDDKRKKKINSLLKIGYTISDLKTAIDGCKISPHHQGANKNKTVYDDIELICRDASHVDSFIKIATGINPNALSESGRATVGGINIWLEKNNAK